MKLVLFTLLCLCAPLTVSAQTVSQITSYNFRQYLPGATTPITAPFSIPKSAVTCNTPAPSPGTPHSIMWDDPDHPGLVCLYVDPGTGPLFAKVYGAFEGTLTALAGTAESPESNRASFTEPPPALTGLKVVR